MPPGIDTGPGDVGSDDERVSAGLGIGTVGADVGDGAVVMGCSAGVGLDPPQQGLQVRAIKQIHCIMEAQTTHPLAKHSGAASCDAMP